MFITKKMFNKLLFFLGLEERNNYIDVNPDYSDRRLVDKREFNQKLHDFSVDYEKYKKLFILSNSEISDKIELLNKKLDKLIRFLDIIEEDFIDIDSFGNKIISQKFVKNTKKK